MIVRVAQPSRTRGKWVGGVPNADLDCAMTPWPSARAPATPTTAPTPNGIMRPSARDPCLATCFLRNRFARALLTFLSDDCGMEVSRTLPHAVVEPPTADSTSF